MSDTRDGIPEGETYTWVDAGHVELWKIDDIRVQRGKVAMLDSTGAVSQFQPDYPPDPEPAGTIPTMKEK